MTEISSGIMWSQGLRSEVWWDILPECSGRHYSDRSEISMESEMFFVDGQTDQALYSWVKDKGYRYLIQDKGYWCYKVRWRHAFLCKNTSTFCSGVILATPPNLTLSERGGWSTPLYPTWITRRCGVLIPVKRLKRRETIFSEKNYYLRSITTQIFR